MKFTPFLAFLLSVVTTVAQVTPPLYPYPKPRPTFGNTPSSMIRYSQAIGPSAHSNENPLMWATDVAGGLQSRLNSADRLSISTNWTIEGGLVYDASDRIYYGIETNLLANKPLFTLDGRWLGDSKNLYTQDGTITSNRTVTLGDKVLSFTATTGRITNTVADFGIKGKTVLDGELVQTNGPFNVNSSAINLTSPGTITESASSVVLGTNVFMRSAGVIAGTVRSNFVWNLSDPATGRGEWAAGGGGGVPVNSIAELITQRTDITQYVQTLGYYSAGDGGAGLYYLTSYSAGATNYSSPRSAHDLTKMWKLVEAGDLVVTRWGAVPDDGREDSVQLQAAITYWGASLVSGKPLRWLVLNPGLYEVAAGLTVAFGGTVTIPPPEWGIRGSGAKLKYTGTGQINGLMVLNFGANVTAYDFNLNGITFEPNDKCSTALSLYAPAHATNTVGLTRARFSDLTIYHSMTNGQIGFNVAGLVNDTRFERIAVRGQNSCCGDGIFISDLGSTQPAMNNVWDQITVTGAASGIHVYSTNHFNSVYRNLDLRECTSYGWVGTMQGGRIERVRLANVQTSKLSQADLGAAVFVSGYGIIDGVIVENPNNNTGASVAVSTFGASRDLIVRGVRMFRGGGPEHPQDTPIRRSPASDTSIVYEQGQGATITQTNADVTLANSADESRTVVLEGPFTTARSIRMPNPLNSAAGSRATIITRPKNSTNQVSVLTSAGTNLYTLSSGYTDWVDLEMRNGEWFPLRWQGSSASGLTTNEAPGTDFLVVSSFAELAAAPVTFQAARTLGYFFPGDGGDGVYVPQSYDPGYQPLGNPRSTVDSSKMWRLLPETSGLRAKQFGANEFGFDNTTNINALILSVGTGGRAVIDGLFTVKPITITSTVHLAGKNNLFFSKYRKAGSGLKLDSAATGSLLTIAMSSTDVILQNLLLDNTSSGSVAGRSALVQVTGTGAFRMDGCGMNIYDSDGLYVYTRGAVVQNCVAQSTNTLGAGNYTGSCLTLDQAHDSIVDGFRVLRSFGSGIRIYKVYFVKVSNLDIRECDGNSLHINGAWNVDVSEATLKGAKRAVIRFGNEYGGNYICSLSGILALEPNAQHFNGVTNNAYVTGSWPVLECGNSAGSFSKSFQVVNCVFGGTDWSTGTGTLYGTNKPNYILMWNGASGCTPFENWVFSTSTLLAPWTLDMMTDYNATLLGMSQVLRAPASGIYQHLNLFGPLGRLDHTNGWRMDVMGNSSAGDYALARNEASKFVKRGTVVLGTQLPTTPLPEDRAVEGTSGPYRPPIEWFIYNDPLATINTP